MGFDKSKYIEQFKAETKEHIQKLNQGVLDLEKDPGNPELFDLLMREAHTVKGAATMMGYRRIVEIAHTIEDGFEKAAKQKSGIEKDCFNLLFECLDAMDVLLEDKVVWEEKGIDRPYLEGLCKKLDDLLSGKIARVPSRPQVKRGAKDGVKKKKKKSLSLTGTAESGRQAAEEVVAPTEVEESIRIDTGKLDTLMNLSGELLVSRIRLHELVLDMIEKKESQEGIDERLSGLIDELKEVDENIDFSSSLIQDEVLGLRMIPVSYLFNTFPRAMRDLAHEKRKDIDFEIKGEDTHLDKSIIDQMKDPIMHLLRNALDHGIEEPAERSKKNKTENGKIILNAFQKGSQVIIEVSDDGTGIDINKVKEKAINGGLITKERIVGVTDEQVIQFLFMPGFSTSEKVTEVSGRGVGLDIVRDRIAKLKGMIEVVSGNDTGTKFIMKLPLTLAITGSLFVSSGSEVFAIPIDTIVETIRVNPQEIKTIETKEAVTVRGHIMPLIRLGDLFGFSARGITEKRFFSVVVVQSVEKKIGLLVDELLGRQEIVCKPLGHPLRKTKNIAGATILGDGRVILVLDIPFIIESAEGCVVRLPVVKPARTKAKKERKTILLAEDVLSTAMLEKNILESAGFTVVIARDGQEALIKAGQEKFNLVITDVLMPKMDGFELTAKLKKDKLYKDVPVIIVTTRDSDADKKRGMEAGADAYILKSDFTSEGLLEVIERLI